MFTFFVVLAIVLVPPPTSTNDFDALNTPSHFSITTLETHLLSIAMASLKTWLNLGLHLANPKLASHIQYEMV